MAGDCLPGMCHQPLQACPLIGPEMWFPESWEVWNQMGGSEKGPGGLGSKRSIKDSFSLGCVAGLTLSPAIL